MERPRMVPSRMLVLPLALAAVAGLTALFPASVAATAGCSSVDVEPAPDAALPECNRGPFTFFCDPAPKAGEPACNTSASTSPLLGRLPQNTDYPVGCVVNFVGSRDPQGDCNLEAVCKCVIEEVPVPGPDLDAGASDDAGDEDAALPPQPTTSAAVWLCAP